jgi:hypothetical protein
MHDSSRLSHADRVFAREYLRNGGNGTRAYLVAHPNASIATATTNASAKLRDTHVRQIIDSALERGDILAIASREQCVSDAQRLMEKAENKEQFSVAVQALDKKAKLNRLYDREQADTTGHAKLLQALQVNVNVNTSAAPDVVELTASDDGSVYAQTD